MSARFFLIILISALLPSFSHAEKPPLLLAKVYRGEVNLAEYWVSEKLDGVRGYWNGKQLLTRQGHPIAAPSWFTQGLPGIELDGELWIARGQFDRVSATIRSQLVPDLAWRDVKYMLFDLPGHNGTFDTRLDELKMIVRQVDQPWIQLIRQQKISSVDRLTKHLDEIVSGGGEGLMLHRSASLYQQGRSSDLLKLKLWQDAEAEVIGHLPGKGKYQSMLGALLVETSSGIRFKLGTGLSDQQRKNPPEIGSVVTYKYTGLTSNGVPRFASFLRIYR